MTKQHHRTRHNLRGCLHWPQSAGSLLMVLILLQARIFLTSCSGSVTVEDTTTVTTATAAAADLNHHATARGEGGSEVHHNTDNKKQGEGTEESSYIDTEDIIHHLNYKEGEVYQLAGELCMNEVCHDAPFQSRILKQQYDLFLQRKSKEQLRTDCRDLWPDCASHNIILKDDDGSRASLSEWCRRDSRRFSYCAHTCQSCFRTYPIQSDPHRERRAKFYTPSSKSEEDDDVIILNAFGSDIGVPQLDINLTQSSKMRRYIKSKSIIIPKREEEDDDQDRNITLVAHQLEQTYEYLEFVRNDDLYFPVRSKCRNQHELCTAWAADGLCTTTLTTKQLQMCGPACETCHLLDYLSRCPVDHNEWNALYPGDLNTLFERILNTYASSHYRITVASRPRTTTTTTLTSTDSSLPTNNSLNDDDDDNDNEPWLMVIDNFLDDQEANYLIQAGAMGNGYTRDNHDKLLADQENVGDDYDNHADHSSKPKTRTTSRGASWLATAECPKQECESNPLVQRVLEKVEQLTGIDRAYYEYLQLLQFNHSNHQNTKRVNHDLHEAEEEERRLRFLRQHDYIAEQRWRMVGARVMTVFFFLNTANDAVEEEEGTLLVEEDEEAANGNRSSNNGIEFPQLGSIIPAKLGRAVIWPNVLDADPHVQDERLEYMYYYYYHHRLHQVPAKTTTKKTNPQRDAIQYIAKLSIHQRKFRVALDKGC